MKRVTIKTLNNLLSILGICVVQIHQPFNGYKYRLGLVDNITWIIYSDVRQARRTYASKLNDLFENIVSCKNFSTIMKTIKNPYFGCKSLEEAMIQKDLFEGFPCWHDIQTTF